MLSTAVSPAPTTMSAHSKHSKQMDGLSTRDTMLLEMVYFMDNVNFVTNHIFLFTLTAKQRRVKYITLIEGLKCTL